MSAQTNFELLRRQSIPELRLEAFHFRHAATGAGLLSLVSGDENKVFGVSLRTPPTASDGAAHILEHCVLCGSRKYPLKDPFLELVKGSLFTFLNAFTYPDATCFPVASQNLQDFYNLIDVYLDAVFYPLLRHEAFLQEGWRLETTGRRRTLELKGVVLNEMKGVYASPDEVLSQYVRASLFPDTAYRFDHGGEPTVIPTLTFEALQAYHRTFYHPSNALFFFSGDDDPDRRLSLLDSFLRDFSRQRASSCVGLQPSFSEPRRHTFYYQADTDVAEQKRCLVTLNWLLGESGDPDSTLAWAIIQHALTGTPASILRRCLLESGLGEDLAGDGFVGQLRQMTFSTGLRGVRLREAGAVEDLILRVLTDTARRGFDPDMIQAAVNMAEFQMREQNSGGMPRGLVMMLGALTAWQRGDDPIRLLPFEDCLARLKENSKRSGYFADMLSRQMLDNNHRTTVVLEPDKHLHSSAQAAERARLKQIRASMSKPELRALRLQHEAFRRWQETPDDKEALANVPMLRLSDIDPKVKISPIKSIQHRGGQILFNHLQTNGICHVEIGLDLHLVPQDFIPFLPLFSHAILELGTDDELERLWQRIGRDTGGVWPSFFNSAVLEKPEGSCWLFLRSKAQTAKLPQLVALLEHVLLHTRLDNRERVKQMVLEEKASLEADLADEGTHLAELRLLAPQNEAYWVDELTSGVSYLQFVRHLSSELDDRLSEICRTFEEIRSRLVSADHMVFHFTAETQDGDACMEQIAGLMDRLPVAGRNETVWQRPTERVSAGFVIQSQVGYVSKLANVFELGFSRHGSSNVVCHHLENTWLWEQIRARGGAYDCSCRLRDGTGALYMSSFRDPDPVASVAGFDGSGRFLRETDLDPEALARSIIGTVGELDTYQLPDAKGYTSLLNFLVGRTDQVRQQTRDEILATGTDDFRHMAGVFDLAATAGAIVVFGPEQVIRRANRAWDNRIKVERLQ